MIHHSAVNLDMEIISVLMLTKEARINASNSAKKLPNSHNSCWSHAGDVQQQHRLVCVRQINTHAKEI